MGIGKILNKIRPSGLFLLDSIGALVSALSAILVSQFVNFFGIPSHILFLLSGIAGLFFVYSLLCYLTKPANWHPWLKGIAIANFLYCGIIAVLIIYLHPKITAWGIAFFAAEIIIVAMLATAEFKKSLRKTKDGIF